VLHLDCISIYFPAEELANYNLVYFTSQVYHWPSTLGHSWQCCWTIIFVNTGLKTWHFWQWLNIHDTARLLDTGHIDTYAHTTHACHKPSFRIDYICTFISGLNYFQAWIGSGLQNSITFYFVLFISLNIKFGCAI
jgi:hypothetical protein